MKRSKHNLSHYRLATLDMGKLYPVACFEVLPGDTIQQATAALIRVSPPVAPVMHPITVRIHHWFVPNRLVWTGWEDFITGGPDGIGGASGAYPTTTGSGTAKDLPDYFGIPPDLPGLVHSALPYRGYARIFNEFYRDEDLVAKIPESTASGNDITTSKIVQSIAWEKDYFTSARPWPQKGPDVSMPLGVSAPVRTVVAGPINSITETSTNASRQLFAGMNAVAGSEIYTDLQGATAVNVNDVRRAFALQRYQEARAMYGSRYTEYLRYIGVRSSDARLQRPEYLGGGKQTISFSEVLQTGPDTADEGVANLKGHGIAAMRSRKYRRFFEEHGHVFTLMSVRPRTMYADGLSRMWSRRTKEDYWQKELERIGQQEVLNKEIYAAHATPDGTFGYADRYAEYRHIQSGISSDFRDVLNYWHLGRLFGAAPVLNASFVTCDPSKRIHAVQTEDVLWSMVSHSIIGRRLVSRSSTGRIL